MGGKKPPKAEELFQRLDKDKDGKISQDEFVSGKTNVSKAKSEFSRSDKNHDRFLSLIEFKAWVKRVADRAAKKEK